MKSIYSIVSLLMVTNIWVYSNKLLASENDTENKNASKVLFENNCLVCHQAHRQGKGKGHVESENKQESHVCKGDHAGKTGADHPTRLAPPMPMVKKHYLRSYPKREEFVEQVAAWIAAPNADAALLHHAVERFGLMPPLGIDKETRQQIAGYIYDEIPAGECKKQHKGGKHDQH